MMRDMLFSLFKNIHLEKVYVSPYSFVTQVPILFCKLPV
uniref:Uncharacterized protein n=1 Tax=Rhizophora mucronata TaxID=61149 RepID=A0A2P2QNF7_RHIMU